MHWLPYILLVCNFMSICDGACPVKAITIVPVGDLVGEPLKTSDSYPAPYHSYDSLPFHSSNTTCFRIHQLLFNETVTILEERNEEVCVQISNMFYEQPYNTIKHDTYWTLKTNIITVPDLVKKGIDLSIIPLPISYKNQPSLTQAKNIATLAFPFHDPVTNTTFSAGTRFVINHTKKHALVVWLLHPRRMVPISIEIPRRFLYFSSKPNTIKKTQNDFVTLIQKWAHQTGCIPYVWGGVSFTGTSPNEKFTKTSEPSSTGVKIIYHRPECNSWPKTGFDCAGLIARAAQICNIPYYFKNTNTLVKYLKPLEPNISVCNGDLLWFPGHVIVISDVQKGLLVEARSYNHGFGKIQEIALPHVFKDITSIEKLTEAYFNKKELKRLDSEGKVVQIIPHFKILMLASA